MAGGVCWGVLFGYLGKRGIEPFPLSGYYTLRCNYPGFGVWGDAFGGLVL